MHVLLNALDFSTVLSVESVKRLKSTPIVIIANVTGPNEVSEEDVKALPQYKDADVVDCATLTPEEARLTAKPSAVRVSTTTRILKRH